jgi:hypothetical protein
MLCFVSNLAREPLEDVQFTQLCAVELKSFNSNLKKFSVVHSDRPKHAYLNPLPNSRVGLKRGGTVCHKIESPQFCHAPGPSVLEAPDPQRTETFSCQASKS